MITFSGQNKFFKSFRDGNQNDLKHNNLGDQLLTLNEILQMNSFLIKGFDQTKLTNYDKDFTTLKSSSLFKF